MLLVFVMPIGIGNIGWKMYIINASWDIIIIVLIVSARVIELTLLPIYTRSNR